MRIYPSRSPLTRSLSGSFSADNLITPLFGMPFSCVQQNIEQHVILPQRVLVRRSVGGSSNLLSGFLMTLNGTWFSSSSVCSSVTLRLSPCDASIQVLFSSRHSLFLCQEHTLEFNSSTYHLILGPTRATTLNDEREGSIRKYKTHRIEERCIVLYLLENDMHENVNASNDGNGEQRRKSRLS